jgi:hypothetical protein
VADLQRSANKMIRPSFGFFVTMGVLNALGAGALLLGGYFNFHAQKTATAVLGIAIGSAALWSAVRLFQRAKAIATETKQSQAVGQF